MSTGQPDRPTYHAPLFEHMAYMSDEAVWELLDVLYGLIDSYEAHYAEPLQRLRLARSRQLHEPDENQRQMDLPFNDPLDNLF